MIRILEDLSWDEIETLYTEETEKARTLLASPLIDDPMLKQFQKEIKDNSFGCQSGYVRSILREILILSGRYSKSQIDTITPSIIPKCRCAFGYLPYTLFRNGPGHTFCSFGKTSGATLRIIPSPYDFQIRHICFQDFPDYLPPEDIPSIFRILRSSQDRTIFNSYLTRDQTEQS